MNDQLTFDHFQAANRARCEAGFLKLDEWSIAEWTNALAGECGEACNIAKKIVRGDYDQPESIQALLALAEELADVIGYADLCMSRIHHELQVRGEQDPNVLANARTGNALVAKFNKVSRKLADQGRLPMVDQTTYPHQLRND